MTSPDARAIARLRMTAAKLVGCVAGCSVQ